MQLPSVGPGGKRQVRSWPVVPLCDAGGPTLQQKLVLTWRPSGSRFPRLSLMMALGRLLASNLATLLSVPWDLCTPLELGNKFKQVLATNGRSCSSAVPESLRKARRQSWAVRAARGFLWLTWPMPAPNLRWNGSLVARLWVLLTAGNKAAERKSSLAFRRGGGAALGVRLLGAVAPDRVCAWRARHVPRSWTPEEVAAALQDVGFLEYDLISPGRGQLPWLFRAKLKDDAGQPSLAIQFGKITVDIERAAAKRKLVDVEAVRVKPSIVKKVASPPSLAATTLSATTAAAAPGTAPSTTAAGGQASQRGRPPSAEPRSSQLENGRDPISASRSLGSRSSTVGVPSTPTTIAWGHLMLSAEINSTGRMPNAWPTLGVAHCGRSWRATFGRRLRLSNLFWLPPDEPQTEAERLNLKQAEGNLFLRGRLTWLAWIGLSAGLTTWPFGPPPKGSTAGSSLWWTVWTNLPKSSPSARRSTGRTGLRLLSRSCTPTSTISS